MEGIDHKDLIRVMGNQGLIPVFNHSNSDIAKKVIDACYNGGVRVFEFTNRGKNAAEVFEILAHHVEQYPDLTLGIGTIFSVDEARCFLDRGARFIVSPAMIPELGVFCNKLNIPWIPGCGTVTEVYQALQLGAPLVKIFPGNVLGPGFVRSLKAVYPNLHVMPTGGVVPTEDNLKAWFDAGVTCVGMGSKLFGKEILASKNFKGLQQIVQNTLSTIEEIRK
jgi:2-dehydro-3-deoxyphosphogluconate aldolase/(4S)-4-hydroxy-2-oxoglutarate aldolase